MSDSEQSKTIISATDDSDILEDIHGSTDSTEAGELRDITVPISLHGERLDKALAEMVPEFSRSYLQQIIISGLVTSDGVELSKSSARIKALDVLRIELKPTPQSNAFRPEAMALDVVFEDDFLMIINKPPGLVVHPAPGNWSGTLLNGLLARDAQAGFLPRAGIVHRLDKDTSGLMVVARQRLAMDKLVSMIAAREVRRQYIAIGTGPWGGAKTRHVDLPIGRDTRNRLKMAVVDLAKNAGRTASTLVTVLDTNNGYCLVGCKLETGRTHQIRVHMAALGHPLVSDLTYGGTLAGGLKRQALHAWNLAFMHPMTGEALEFRSDLPSDMQQTLVNLGLSYNLTGLS